MGKLKAAGWLAEQEQKYRIVLYVADSAVTSPWTQTCIRQADYVMVVGMGEDPSLGEYERLLLSMKTTARKELVLLHPDRSVVPGSTREWLKVCDMHYGPGCPMLTTVIGPPMGSPTSARRATCQCLHYVSFPYSDLPIQGVMVSVPRSVASPQDPAAVAALKNLKDRVQSGIQRYRGGPTDPRPQRGPHTNDFSRLARRICGKSIGLVLGGGGARGISHLVKFQVIDTVDQEC